jgi:hypothetical protein
VPAVVRPLLWFASLLLVVSVIVVPAVYFQAASHVPPLETQYDLEALLRSSVEGQRREKLVGTVQEVDPQALRFVRPDFATLPKDLVALYITEMGCPTFFQTPREEGAAWTWRLVAGALAGGHREGDGACERIIALRLARALGVQGELPQAVAAHRLHGFLQKDQLVAYDLATFAFEPGVVGVEDAARVLFEGRQTSQLSLAELAELMLTLPPHGYYDEVKHCTNALLLRQGRDQFLARLASVALIAPERVKSAREQPLTCER